jgi:hypothetical protein
MAHANPDPRAAPPPRAPAALVWLELVAIAACAALFAYYYVPTHRTTIWFNPEITGWVVPIANRMEATVRLYSDGLHIPMPPLPFVILRYLPGDDLPYLAESFANFLAQTGSLLLLYASLRRRVGRSIAFYATLASFPLYFLMTKSLLYDSLAQLHVSAMAVLAVAIAIPHGARGARAAAGRNAGAPVGKLLLLSAASIGCLLSKQNTAIGAIAGAVALLLFFPQERSPRNRIRNAAVYFALSLVCLAMAGLAIAPVVDLRGMIVDVFLTGSEPKGGTAALLAKLAVYVGMLLVGAGCALAGAWLSSAAERRLRRGRALFVSLLAACVSLWIALHAGRPDLLDSAAGWATALDILAVSLAGGWLLARLRERGDAPADPAASAASEDPKWTGAAIAGALLGLVGILVVPVDLLLAPGIDGAIAQRNLLVDPILDVVLVAGLAFLLVLVARGRRSLSEHPPSLLILAAYFAVLLPAAVFQNLSGTDLARWSKHANPLITAVVVLGAWTLVHRAGAGLRSSRAPARAWIVAAALLLFQAAAWTLLNEAYSRLRHIDVVWDDVRFLRGAKMPRSGEEMHQLVRRVRTLAPDPNDTVLLLPNDPNVEAWFERPRPRLTSALVFTDQYWDRYVDEDFRRISEDPPKVIVIGPHRYWAIYTQGWHPGWGAFRLVQRVQTELLPKSYQKPEEIEIDYWGMRVAMHLYTRIDPER